jgi:hypothetical protein
VRKRDRSEEVDRAAGKVVFPVGGRSAVLCASGAWCPNGPGGHARTSRVNTQASVLRWSGWAGRQEGSSARRGRCHSSTSIVCTRQFSPGGMSSPGWAWC